MVGRHVHCAARNLCLNLFVFSLFSACAPTLTLPLKGEGTKAYYIFSNQPNRLLTIILIFINLFDMFVCICKQVTDSQIKQAVCEGACSFKDVQAELGVATQCGECKNHVRQCMRASHHQNQTGIFSSSNKLTEIIALP